VFNYKTCSTTVIVLWIFHLLRLDFTASLLALMLIKTFIVTVNLWHCDISNTVEKWFTFKYFIYQNNYEHNCNCQVTYTCAKSI